MTDDAKAVEMTAEQYANLILTVGNRDESGHLMFSSSGVRLAKAFLALSEKCRSYEAVAEAVKHFAETILHNPHPTIESAKDNARYILEALEPGDSDE